MSWKQWHAQHQCRRNGHKWKVVYVEADALGYLHVKEQCEICGETRWRQPTRYNTGGA